MGLNSKKTNKYTNQNRYNYKISQKDKKSMMKS